MNSTPENTFEASLEELNQIAKKLESGELTLDQSLGLFESGIKLARQCQSQLSQAEQKVELLLKADAEGKVQTAPFTQRPNSGN